MTLDTAAALPRWRSILFVPADKADRLDTALRSGADAICIELEDGVAAQNKDVARRNAIDFLFRADGELECGILLRINDPGSTDGKEDLAGLAALAQRGMGPRGVVIPKVRRAREVRETGESLGDGSMLIPMIETAEAVWEAASIARADKRVAGLLFGGFDLALELGAEPLWEPLLFGRSRVVAAAALAGIRAWDMPSREIKDASETQREARRVRALGFTGKTLIHPSQVEPVHEAFRLTKEEARRARRIAWTAHDGDGGPFAVDGRLVDRPIAQAAAGTLERGPEPERGGAAAAQGLPRPR